MQSKMLDNKGNGKVCGELVANIHQGAKLSVISAYFAIYTLNEIKGTLSKIDSMKFIFTESTFVKNDYEIAR